MIDYPRTGLHKNYIDSNSKHLITRFLPEKKTQPNPLQLDLELDVRVRHLVDLELD